MSLWQYNAWCEAHMAKVRDTLSIQIQAAWLGAYWSSAAKHKKSLKSVLKIIQKQDTEEKRKPINMKEVVEMFRQFEELQKYGRTQVTPN